MTIWESEISPRFLFHFLCSSFWAIVIFSLYSIFVYIIMIIGSFKLLGNVWGYVLISEVFVLFVLAIVSFSERKRVSDYSQKRLN